MSRCCFASIHYKPGDCSQNINDRNHANLVKSKGLQGSPMYLSRQSKQFSIRDISILSTTLDYNSNDPSASLIQKDPSQGYVDAISLHQYPTNLSLTTRLIPVENIQTFIPSTTTFHNVSPMKDEHISNNFSTQTSKLEDATEKTQNDSETRKTTARSSLESVPELSELKVNRKRSNRASSTVKQKIQSNQPHQIVTGPSLTTFDSHSIQRRR